MQLYENARRQDSDQARAVIQLIEESGLSLRHGGGLPGTHPAIVQIDEVMSSAEGRAALKRASDEGLPALAGVDHILKQRLDGYYGQFDSTGWAGTYAAREMYRMGYKQIGKGKMPDGSVAKSAARFGPK